MRIHLLPIPLTYTPELHINIYRKKRQEVGLYTPRLTSCILDEIMVKLKYIKNSPDKEFSKTLHNYVWILKPMLNIIKNFRNIINLDDDKYYSFNVFYISRIRTRDKTLHHKLNKIIDWAQSDKQKNYKKL